jgi:putative FmdB family regulatory protein
MPTYGYVCDHCGYEFEQFQPITARPTRKCPKCGKLSVHRLIGAGAGIIFKGSGFYQTDYRTDSYKKASESETKTTDSSTAEKKTEVALKDSKLSEKAKPAAKDKKKSA